MSYQKTFKRYEMKYLITKEQKAAVVESIEPYMALDRYGHTVIKNLYFDTSNYRLIRRSIEKPDYKEKIRIRGYGDIDKDSEVFVEIKKKYDKVVYKRRISMRSEDANNWLCNEGKCPIEGQIASEIDYFINYYGKLVPSLFLSYEREAYYEKDGGDFRVTFDNNVCCRQDDLTIEGGCEGFSLLDDDQVLMEIKCSGGIPIWMTEILSENNLYKTSFSKYGTAYEKLIFPKLKGGKKNE